MPDNRLIVEIRDNSDECFNSRWAWTKKHDSAYQSYEPLARDWFKCGWTEALRTPEPVLIDGMDAAYWKQKFLDMQTQWEKLAFKVEEDAFHETAKVAKQPHEHIKQLVDEVEHTLYYFRTEFPKNCECNKQIWADSVSYHCGGVSPDDLEEISKLLRRLKPVVSGDKDKRPKHMEKHDAFD